MTLNNTLFILLAFCLAGCLSPKENSSGSSFEATPVQLLEAPKKISTNEFGLTNKKVFTLKTCFFDKATLEPKVGEKFFITVSGKKNHVPLLEPKSGCVSWQEVIQFEPLAAENNIYFSRTFESSSSGNITLPFSIDPWTGTDALTDLRVSPSTPHTEETRSAFALAGKSEYDPKVQLPPGRVSNLSIENIDGQLVNAGVVDGLLRRELSISFKGSLFRRSKDNGETKLIPSSGRAKVRAAILVVKPILQSKKLVTDIETTEGTWKDGRLDVKLSFNIPGDIEENSELVFLYRVESLDQPHLIIPIEGEKNFTRDRVVKLSGTPKEYAANGNFAPGIPRRDDKPLNARSFILSSWKASYVGFEPYDPTTWESETYLEFEICLKDSFTRLPLIGYSFSTLLSKANEWDEKSSISLRPTNELGCTKWTQTVAYPYADQEETLNYHLLVKDEKYKTQNNIQSVRVGINPWQKGALVFRDIEQLGPLPQKEVKPEEKGIFLEVSNVEYEAKRRSFEVNSHLYLTSIKKYQFHLKPYLQRKSSPTDKKHAEESVVPGTRIKVVGALVQNLEADPQSDTDKAYQDGFLSGFETEGTVDNRKKLNFEAAFPVEFSHISKLDSRLKVVLKLTPIGKGVLPRETVIAAKFKADPLTEEGLATSMSYEVSQLIPETLLKSKKIRKLNYSHGVSYALQFPWNDSPMELYQKFWKGFSNLATISIGEKPISTHSGNFENFLSETHFSEKEKSDLKEFFLKQNSSFLNPALAAFCKELEGKSSNKNDYSNCTREPNQFFQMSTFNLMENFSNVPAEIVKGKPITLNVMASFAAENNFVERDIAGERKSKQFSFSVGGKIGYEHFGSGGALGAGFSKQHDVYRAVEAAATDEISQRINLNELILLRGEAKTLQFSASYRSCVFVRPLAVIQVTVPLRSFLFCSDPKTEKMQETWYFLREATLGSGPVFGDDKDPKERNWVKLIRGTRLYDEFKGRLEDNSKARLFELKKVSIFKEGLENVIEPDFTDLAARERLKSDGSVFPGVSDFKEFTSLQWTEPQISERTQNVVAAYLSRVPEDRKQDEKLISRIYKASRCYIESIAREMPYSKFLEDPRSIISDAKRVAREEFCHRFAKVE